jgi:hypothetical protein
MEIPEVVIRALLATVKQLLIFNLRGKGVEMALLQHRWYQITKRIPAYMVLVYLGSLQLQWRHAQRDWKAVLHHQIQEIGIQITVMNFFFKRMGLR